MAQSGLMSFIETLTNVFVGFVIALITQAIVFPLFAIAVSLHANVWVAVILSALSVARSFVVRRVFETFRYVPPRELLRRRMTYRCRATRHSGARQGSSEPRLKTSAGAG